MALSLDDLTNIAIGQARRPTTVGAGVFLEFSRNLDESDLDLVLNPPPKGITTSPLSRLRNSHHMLARLLAEGRGNSEAALVTGYSPSRISILRGDPAFASLVEYYSTQVEAKYLDVHERLAMLGLSSVDELQERLENDPDSYSNKDLMALAEFALDRSVTKDARKGGPGGGTAPAIAITFVGSPSGPPKGGSVTIDGVPMSEPAEGGAGTADDHTPASGLFPFRPA